MEISPDPLHQKIDRLEFEAYNHNPYESAKTEIRQVFNLNIDTIKTDVSFYKQALASENWKNPVTPEKQALKSQMEQFLREDEASLNWLEHPSDDTPTRILIAAKADRLAEWSLFFAKSNSGGERLFQNINGLTQQERFSLELAGKLFYTISPGGMSREIAGFLAAAPRYNSFDNASSIDIPSASFLRCRPGGVLSSSGRLDALLLARATDAGRGPSAGLPPYLRRAGAPWHFVVKGTCKWVRRRPRFSSKSVDRVVTAAYHTHLTTRIEVVVLQPWTNITDM